MTCEHVVLELDQGSVPMMHGMVHVDTITCLMCPVTVVLTQADDTRDEIRSGRALDR